MKGEGGNAGLSELFADSTAVIPSTGVSTHFTNLLRKPILLFILCTLPMAEVKVQYYAITIRDIAPSNAFGHQHSKFLATLTV